MIGPIARPEPEGSGRAWASHITLFCGPSRAWAYLLRAGPGPGLIIQFAGRARAGSSQLLRARAGPGPQIIFAGRAWASISGPCRTLIHRRSQMSEHWQAPHSGVTSHLQVHFTSEVGQIRYSLVLGAIYQSVCPCGFDQSGQYGVGTRNLLTIS